MKILEEIHEEDAMMEETMEDEELMVTITDSAVLGGTQVDLEFSSELARQLRNYCNTRR